MLAGMEFDRFEVSVGESPVTTLHTTWYPVLMSCPELRQETERQKERRWYRFRSHVRWDGHRHQWRNRLGACYGVCSYRFRSWPRSVACLEGLPSDGKQNLSPVWCMVPKRPTQFPRARSLGSVNSFAVFVILLLLITLNVSLRCL